jgi:hypothetical protein
VRSNIVCVLTLQKLRASYSEILTASAEYSIFYIELNSTESTKSSILDLLTDTSIVPYGTAVHLYDDSGYHISTEYR